MPRAVRSQLFAEHLELLSKSVVARTQLHEFLFLLLAGRASRELGILGKPAQGGRQLSFEFAPLPARQALHGWNSDASIRSTHVTADTDDAGLKAFLLQVSIPMGFEEVGDLWLKSPSVAIGWRARPKGKCPCEGFDVAKYRPFGGGFARPAGCALDSCSNGLAGRALPATAHPLEVLALFGIAHVTPLAILYVNLAPAGCQVIAFQADREMSPVGHFAAREFRACRGVQRSGPYDHPSRKRCRVRN